MRVPFKSRNTPRRLIPSLSDGWSRTYVKDRIMRRNRGYTHLVLDCSDFWFT